jgi:H+-transporting ATPase
MADSSATGAAPALSTNIPGGHFNDEEKAAHNTAGINKEKAALDEEEDEDIDALIDDLESEAAAPVSAPPSFPGPVPLPCHRS